MLRNRSVSVFAPPMHCIRLPRPGHVMATANRYGREPEIVDVAVIKPQPGFYRHLPAHENRLASEEIKAAVLAYLDPETRRPMGDYVTVKSPEPVAFDLTVTVRVREGGGPANPV